MADIFISYKREDRESAKLLAESLGARGFDVWWDFELLSGDRYRKVIERVIDECKAAIVIWSEKARESAFVVDEAAYAHSIGKLCPLKIQDCRPPLGFGGLHVNNLITWKGEADHPGFVSLLRAIEGKTGKRAEIGAAPRTTLADDQAAELEAFKAAQITGSADALRAFVEAYPAGVFANFVRGQLNVGTPASRPKKSRTAPRKARFNEANYVFVSYPTDIDPPVLLAVVRKLLEHKLSVWLYDPSAYDFTDEELAKLRWQEAGGSWRRQTLDGIERAAAVVGLINEYSLESRFQPQEFEMAARAEKLLPCIVSNLDLRRLPDFFQDLHTMRITAETLDKPQGQKRLNMLGRDVASLIARARND